MSRSAYTALSKAGGRGPSGLPEQAEVRPLTEHDTAGRLLAAARAAAANARPKHSGFRVGAAVLDERGRMHPGCNVESDSYSLTICAERVAIFAALASGAQALRGLAVSCPDAPEGPAGHRMPCGACRQVLVEWLAPDAAVLVDGVGRFTPADLLPDAFRLQKDPKVC